MGRKTRKLAFAALIAAIYAALTLALAPFSFGQIQVRVSEALTVLPFFSSFPIAGLFVGCITANFIGGNGIVDIIFGSAATLVAACITYFIGKSNLKFKIYLAPLPPVVINAIVIGFELKFVYHLPLFISMLSVGFGEMIACYVIGLPLLFAVNRSKILKDYLES